MKIEIMNLPKVGNIGLAIPYSYQSQKKWKFNQMVANFMRQEEITECWFQCYDSKGWKWSHGIVALKSNEAIITQFG